jgi:hypothetical protein
MAILQAQQQVAIAQIPYGRLPYQDPNLHHSRGLMNHACPKCGALHFLKECLAHSSIANPAFGTCCLQGKIHLDLFSEPPTTLQDLLTGASLYSTSFLKNICRYNAALTFTSLAVNLDHWVANASGPQTFRIHGALHHNMGSLLPDENHGCSYAQWFIIDSQAALNEQVQRNTDLIPAVMSDLDAIL